MLATMPSDFAHVDKSQQVVSPSSLPRGVILDRVLKDDPGQRYYVYLPTTANLAQAPVLVTVHGISRNARIHVRHYAPLAEQRGIIVVAPRFSKTRFPDYQRLGRAGRGARADHMLERILAEVGGFTGADVKQPYLFGYSGGGQFVHRYAMAYPQRVAAIAIGAAGWYTFPEPERRYPYGIKSTPDLPDVHFDAGRFLRIPACVLVGEEDDMRDAALRQSDRLDRRQGATRFERGCRWVEAMNAAARAHGLTAHYRFIALPGADHSFSRSVRHGDMAVRVFDCLFSDGTRENAQSLQSFWVRRTAALF